MEHASQAEVTQLLEALEQGDSTALDRLFPLVYEELRAVAHRQRRRWQGDDSLNTTALVHEAYLKLVDQTQVKLVDRSHFLAVATQAMRRILVDYARRYRADKRGGGAARVSLSEELIVAEERADMLLALDEALVDLARLDERVSRVVECRFFGGLTEEETAEVLGVTARTVRRDWTKAKGWLHGVLR